MFLLSEELLGFTSQYCEALCSTTEPYTKAKIVRLALTTEAQLFWGPLSDLLL